LNRTRLPIALWLALVVICVAIVARTEVTTDLGGFLPGSPTPAQQVLVDELRDGVVARLILIGIEGADQKARAALSARLADALRPAAEFAYVANGASDRFRADGAFLLRHRYLLSDAVTPARFSVAGLRAALEDRLDELASSTSVLTGQLLARDPTGEFLHLLERLSEDQGQGPQKRDDVWFSADGGRALLIAQTRAPGFDIDAQERALAKIRAEFEAARSAAGIDGARLEMSGPGVFAVASRAGIKGDAIRFSALATVLVSVILLTVYRSPRVLGLTLLPVASGALAGIAAVSLGFGSVHGITLGFGATLIGEAVDYAIYLFTNTSADSPPRKTLARIWPTLRLGMMTSVIGFGAMLFSGFPGLAQLGLFSIAGLIAALLVTRWLLPVLAPDGYQVRAADALAPLLANLVARARVLRLPLIALVALAAGALMFRGGAIWDDEIAGLSPVSAEDQRLDESMRADLGAPDVRQLIVVRGATEEAVLQTAENVGAALQPLISDGLLGGYDSPARYLPSLSAQRARQQAIPATAQLRRDLVRAAQGLPFRADAFPPFLDEAEAARRAAPLSRADLEGTGLGLKVEALLAQRRGEWHAMLPLRGAADDAALRQALASFDPGDVVLLDLKQETDTLYQDYRARVMTSAAIGIAAITALLLVTLRSPARAFAVLAPLVAAVLVTTAVMVSGGAQLNIFHVVALLLVFGVGSNYTLFFERSNTQGADRERSLASALFCNLSTVIGFGVIGFSSTPVLSAIGTTVAVGAFLSLAFAAILTARSPH